MPHPHGSACTDDIDELANLGRESFKYRPLLNLDTDTFSFLKVVRLGASCLVDLLGEYAFFQPTVNAISLIDTTRPCLSNVRSATPLFISILSDRLMNDHPDELARQLTQENVMDKLIRMHECW
jgi:hypothetical protein